MVKLHDLKSKNFLVLGFTGASGSGKTTLTKKLQTVLDEDVVILSQDNYYNDLSHLAPEKRKEVNFDDPAAIDFDFLIEHLQILKDGLSIEQPIYDFTTHTRSPETVKITSRRIVLVEGSLLFAVPRLRNILDMKFFIDADMDICLLRRIERDHHERKRSFIEIRQQYLSTVRPMFLKYLIPSKIYADLIIPNARHDLLVLDFISKQLSEMITSSIHCPNCHKEEMIKL